MIRFLRRIPLCSTPAIPRKAMSIWQPITQVRLSTSGHDASNISKEGELRKADLVAILAAEYKITLAQSARILDTVLDTIVEAVAKKHTVSISNFGKFEPITSPPRMYNHPQQKKQVWKEEITRVKFRPYVNFKECVSGKRVNVGSGDQEPTQEE